MGLFYTNITLRGPSQQQVAEHLKALGRTAHVSPTVDGFTVVYDRQTEDQDKRVLTGLACDLSQTFRCPALAALVHDSDVFAYWLCESGGVTDTYDSIPAYFGGEPSPPAGGDVEKLCRAFGREGAIDEVQRILDAVRTASLSDDWSPGQLFGEDIHRQLAAALGTVSYTHLTLPTN